MLKHKKVLVAGAGGLLGSAVVAELLKVGAEVVATDINISGMKKRLESNSVNVDSVKLHLATLDITSENEVKSFFKNQVGLTGAVNCSYPRNKQYGTHFLDVSLESFNENVNLHLGSSFLFAQQCAAYFKSNSSPFSLVNIASIYGVIAPEFGIYEETNMTMPVEYAAIKSAVIHLNKYVVNYINDSNFRVNSVSPGGILDGQPEAFLNKYKKNTHGEGMLSPEDMLGAIVFLLSDSANYMTGQNIVIDDGFSL